MGTDKRARQKAGRQQRLQQVAQTQQRDQRKRSVGGFLVVLALVAVAVVVILLTQKDKKSPVATGTSSTVAGSTVAPTTVPLYGTSACPAADGSARKTIAFTSQPKNCLVKGKTYVATFKTTAGTVEVDLDTKATPATTNNFVFLSRYHAYDGSTFFRVSQGIDIIQGGDLHGGGSADPGPGYDLRDEPTMTADPATGGLSGPYTYAAGDLVMARSSQPNGASAQFFFVTGPNGSGLSAGSGQPGAGTYVKFGHVTSGLAILKKIVATAKADPNSATGDQAPDPKVTVTSVTISEK